MSKKPEVHTVRHGGGWANRRAASDSVSEVYPTLLSAQQIGHTTAWPGSTDRILDSSTPLHNNHSISE